MKAAMKLVYQLMLVQTEKLSMSISLQKETNDMLRTLVVSKANSDDELERFKLTTNERLGTLEGRRHG